MIVLNFVLEFSHFFSFSFKPTFTFINKIPLFNKKKINEKKNILAMCRLCVYFVTLEFNFSYNKKLLDCAEKIRKIA